MKNHLTRFLRSPGTNNLVVLTSEDIFNAKKYSCAGAYGAKN